MATRPELHIAVAKQKSKASEYNDNFDMMMDYCEAVSTEAKNYVDDTLAGNVFYRILGETIFSLIPLADASVHLLDGSIISGSGIYADFVEHIASLATNYPDCFCTESQWQTSVAQYGVCGKFVNNGTSVRLPKVTGIVEGTIDATALGDLVQAGLPNITASMRESGAMIESVSGAFTRSDNSYKIRDDVLDVVGYQTLGFNASRSSSIYGNSTTVQPQTIKGYYYIVVATATKTDIEVDIDEIASDLNGKAERDLSNITSINANSPILNIRNIDYSNGVSISTQPTSASKYTALADGVYVACVYLNQTESILYINNRATSYIQKDGADGQSYSNIYCPLSKGDVIYWDKTFTYHSAKFYSYKA